MTRDEIENLYFNWMCSIVNGTDERSGRDVRPGKFGYLKLLTELHSREFYFILPMDEDRASDGLYLRNRFAWECNLDELSVRTVLEDKPCSVLEMMLALSIRIEEEHMGIADDWFWLMVLNMGLKGQRDEVFNRGLVKAAIDILLERRYEPNGIGGLFILRSMPEKDLRDETIWNQMNWYLLENYPARFDIG